MSLSLIKSELMEILQSVTGLPKIINEDENFKPKTNADYPFTRATLIPAESRRQDLNSGKQQKRGLFRIDLFGSRSLNTSLNISTVAEAIEVKFMPTLIPITNGQLIIEAVWTEVTKYEGTVMQVPVFVRWSALTQ